MTCLSDIDVVLLCGGLGTRTGNPDQPKVLTPLAGQPALEYMLDYFKKHGAKRVVLCTGHHGDQVEDYLAKRLPDFLDIVVSQETEQRGTAAALILARPYLKSDYVLVANGDTLTDCDISRFISAVRTLRRPLNFAVARSQDGKVESTGFRLLSKHALDSLIPDVDLDDWLQPRAHVMFLNGRFFDIGTPERLRLAEHFCHDHRPHALSS